MIRQEGIFHVNPALNYIVKACMGISALVAVFKFCNEFLQLSTAVQAFADYLGLISVWVAFGILCSAIVKQGNSWGWILLLSIVASVCGKMFSMNIANTIGALAEIVIVILLLINYDKYIRYYAIGYLATAFIGVFLGMGLYIMQNVEHAYFISKAISLTMAIVSLICYYYFAKSFTDQ